MPTLYIPIILLSGCQSIDTCRDYIVRNPIVGWIAIPHIYVGVQDHLTFGSYSQITIDPLIILVR